MIKSVDFRADWVTRLFYALYILVSIATFRHSAHGFASIEGGSLAWGALSALAVDAGMLLSASGLRRGRSWALVIGLVISAGASTFTQLLYSIANAQALTVAPGAQWLGNVAVTIVNARVVALPALLPLLSVIYAFSAKSARIEQPSDLEELAAEIRAQEPKKTDRARRLLELSGKGYTELTEGQIADLAQCHPATVRKVKAQMRGLEWAN